MREIIKTLLVSLSLAATGAGVAWSLTGTGDEPLLTNIVELTSNMSAKADRLDMAAPKADRMPVADIDLSGGAVSIVSPAEQSSSAIVASAR